MRGRRAGAQRQKKKTATVTLDFANVTFGGEKVLSYMLRPERVWDATTVVETHLRGEKLGTTVRRLNAAQCRTTVLQPQQSTACEEGCDGGGLAIVSSQLQGKPMLTDEAKEES